MKRLLCIAIALAPMLAHATGSKNPPTPTPAPPPAPTSNSHSSAEASAAAAAAAIAGAAATGGDARATGGDARATSGDSSAITGDSKSIARTGDSTATANTDGNSQAIEYNTPRQVPPVFLASLMVSECGAGASAGGAGSGGAGAFGVVWTTKRCYALRSAINFFAVGEYRTGCELLGHVNREALKAIGRTLDCEAMAVRLEREARMSSTPPAAAPPAAAVTPPPAAPDMSKYVTREEAERMWRQSVSK